MKHKPESVKKEPVIIDYISMLLSENLSEITGEAITVAVEKTDFEGFQIEAEKIINSRSLLVYSDTDHAVMNLLLTDSSVEIFNKLFKYEQGDDSSITEIINRIAQNLPYLCRIREEGTVFSFQKTYSRELKDQLLWDASECNIFRCSGAGAVFYLMFNTELQKEIEKLLISDSPFNEYVQRLVKKRNVHENGLSSLPDTDIKLKIKNPHEFIIGRCILPSDAYLGKKDFSVIFSEITAAKQPVSKINKEIIWYRFGIISKETEYPLYYSADVKSREKKYLQLFNSLFTELVKKTALYLRRQNGFDRINGKIVNYPDPADLKEAVILTAEIKWENRRIKTQVFVPASFLSEYLASSFKDRENEYLKTSKISVLLNLLSINSSMFGKRIINLYKAETEDSSKSETSLISVSKIISLLDNNTAIRLVQNYFLAGGSSLDDFQSLFLYRYSPEGADSEKTGQDPLFSKEEYKKYIPAALHTDWAHCKGISSSYDEMINKNEEALKGIYKAIQNDQLLMPYKVSFILYNVFQKPLDERFKKEIEKLVNETRWKELVENIPKKTGQLRISAIPALTLGTALIPGYLTVKEISHLMSRKKQSEVEDELKINTAKYDAGSISAETVFLSLKELSEVLKELSAPDDEMVF